MTGALINALGIIAGGAWGLVAKKPLSTLYQEALKNILGVYTLWLGLRLTWVSLEGNMRQVLGELALVVLAMILGKITGRLLRLQKMSNSLGRRATQTLAAPSEQKKFDEGFLLATGLFCVGPLALLGSVQEGLGGFAPIFLVKAGFDGLATFAFCRTFGWGAALAAVPVLALESALIRGAHLAGGALPKWSWPLTDAINATDGLLIFCVAMIILGLKKIEVADYFPSLAFAPLLTWWLWR